METFTTLAILTLSDVDFAAFLMEYPERPPESVAVSVLALTPAQRSVLFEQEQLGMAIHTRACETGDAVQMRWLAASGWWDCGALQSTAADAARWGADGLLADYAAQQRDRVIAGLALDDDS